MKFWSKRKSDEEYVEQMRKNFKRRWPLVRVFLLIFGLAYCGFFIWFMSVIPRIGYLLNWTDADYVFKMKIVLAFVLGTAAGSMSILSVLSLLQGIFWHTSKWNNDIRLMLKYHDALVAHGILSDLRTPLVTNQS